ncbi:MAG: sodium:solute symporter family protein [Planctomycetota bacterium]
MADGSAVGNGPVDGALGTSESSALLDTWGLAIVGGYLFVVLGLGVLARFARRENTLSDFYLGGRDLGLPVLFLTLYATQYSGLTFVGLVGKAYRQGFSFFVGVTFTMGIVGAYLLLAPKLFPRARQAAYITTGDFVQDRYRSSALTAVASLVWVFALGSYILSNLKAAGYIVHAATGGTVGVAGGIIALSVLMLVYETLGGMRGVAWTDVMQGVLLFIACLLLCVATTSHYGAPAEIGERLREVKPHFWDPPSAHAKRTWLSTLLLVSAGVSIYPHAIQRIYAARSPSTLRRSLQLMVFMPLLTMLPMIWIGIVGAAHFSLDSAGSERTLLVVLQGLVEAHPEWRLLVVLLVAGIIAAIMSTVDSALLSISSLFTQDFYRRILPESSPAQLTRVGKVFSCVLMAIVAYLAIVLPRTLWRITEIKLEVLCQLAPAMYLGLYSRRVSALAIAAGLATGLLVALVSFFGPDFGWFSPKPLGIHGGVWGLLANVAVVAAVTWSPRGK